ncbi:MAG: signal recognition particle protein [Clostridia bacterium]|nr:signal recognition particle protein [Clostridia bacterium]
MAFDNLMEKLQGTFKKLRGKGKVSEADVKAAMREVRLALLEADVNFKVVKEFVGKVSERAVGAEVLESLTPAQHIIKIVREELVALMGGEHERLKIASKPPTVIMMVGLQGAGKTTASAKLAANLKKKGKRPLLVACDIYRPAAIKQLQVVGGQVETPVFTMGEINPVEIAQEAVKHAKDHGNDIVILDTAGRLHIDEALMGELCSIKEMVEPDEILLVLDSMTGQDAVNVAESFHEQLDITGVVLTKLDGDARGGAALSVRAVTGKPIKFAGMGEKMTDLEEFHPDRMASRILGMGDVLTLIDKAQDAFDEKQAKELEEKLRKNQFTFEEFLGQLHQMKKMGPLSQIVGMLPGVNAQALDGAEIDDRKLDRIEAIILSMTPQERRNPGIINASRKQRIAKGSGMKVQDVNALLKQFQMMQKMFKQMNNKNMMKSMKKKGKRGFRFPL